LTDFKLVKSRQCDSQHVTHMFRVIRSNRPEMEIWQIFDLRSGQNTRKRLMWTPQCYSLVWNWLAQSRWCCDQKRGNSIFFACAVHIWLKTTQKDWHRIATHRKCHF